MFNRNYFNRHYINILLYISVFYLQVGHKNPPTATHNLKVTNDKPFEKGLQVKDPQGLASYCHSDLYHLPASGQVHKVKADELCI